MNVRLIARLGFSVLLFPLPVSAHPDLLIYRPAFNINGWKVSCGGLEGAKTECMAEHRDATPYLYLQFWPDRINAAASLDCTHDGYAPAVAVERGDKSTSDLISEVDDKLNGPLKACPNEPMGTQFRTELNDIQSLPIRTTAIGSPRR